MSEHTPLTEAEVNLVEFVRTFETGEAAANALPLMLPLLREISARTSTATADTELRERVEAVTERAVNSAYGTDPRHRMLAQAVAAEVFDGTPWPWSLSAQFGQYATPASTEDRADNEGTP